MWVLFRALFEHRFWPFAFLLRLLKADFRVLRLLNRFWEGLLKKFAFVEPFLKQRGALHHRDSTWPVLDACFYLLDDCWIGPFCVEWMLDEPNFYADFENSRWMGVGYPLDGSVFARRNKSSTYRGKFDYLTGFFEKTFSLFIAAHILSRTRREFRT